MEIQASLRRSGRSLINLKNQEPEPVDLAEQLARIRSRVETDPWSFRNVKPVVRLHGPTDIYLDLAAYIKGAEKRRKAMAVSKRNNVYEARTITKHTTSKITKSKPRLTSFKKPRTKPCSVPLIDVLKSDLHSMVSKGMSSWVTVNISGEERRVFYRHGKDGECPVCCTRYPNLRLHMTRSHSSGYLCQLCDLGTIFRRVAHFLFHLAVVHNIENAGTEEIEKSGIKISTLGVPVLQSGLIRFCDSCGRRVYRRSAHRKLAHDKAFVCKVCPEEQVFYLPKGAENHLVTKHSEKKGGWAKYFYKISTINLPFALPLPENWKTLHVVSQEAENASNVSQEKNSPRKKRRSSCLKKTDRAVDEKKIKMS